MRQYYIKAYEDRMNKAFEEMEQEGLTDCDSHDFIYHQGDFNAEEIAGYYFQTYKENALFYWNSNTKDKKLDKIGKNADKILNFEFLFNLIYNNDKDEVSSN